MRVLAVVPVKPLGRALGRLAGVLAPRERRELQDAMLADLLSACAGCRDLAGTLVVTADPTAAALARAHGAQVLPDHAPPQGMNPAVAIGQARAAATGMHAVLVLTADLPLAAPADLSAIIDASPGEDGLVLVPSRDGTGTNALLISPPGGMPTRLGPDSRALHTAAAAAAGLRVRELERPRVALDVDTPGDLLLLAGSDLPGRATALCARIGVTGRLAAGIAP
jgi:2-phospho-L-lactate guanylyltransferase